MRFSDLVKRQWANAGSLFVVMGTTMAQSLICSGVATVYAAAVLAAKSPGNEPTVSSVQRSTGPIAGETGGAQPG